MAEPLDCITASGDRAIVVEPNGAYASTFFEAGDVIFNPYNKRAPGWTPFAEVRKPYDLGKIARSILRDGRDPDAAWHFYSQVLIAGVMRALIREGRATTAAHTKSRTGSRPAERLAKLVAGAAAAGLFDKDAARVRTTCSSPNLLFFITRTPLTSTRQGHRRSYFTLEL